MYFGLYEDSPEKVSESRHKIYSNQRSVAVDKVRELIKKQPERKPAISEVR